MFRVDVTFQDTYDFDNTRHGEYDKYRKKLARLLGANDFDGFENAYYREVQPADRWHKTKLDNAAIFASFMYALEMKGWTPGSLPWEVTVPMDVSAFEKSKRTKH